MSDDIPHQPMHVITYPLNNPVQPYGVQEVLCGIATASKLRYTSGAPFASID